MRPITDRNRTMNSASNIAALTRNAAFALVEREERRAGSRMIAYENVASKIGASSSWLRKFLRDDASVSTIVFNILSQYESLCSRVELETENELAKIARLRGEIDAATPRALGALEGEGRTSAPRKANA